MTHGSLPVLNGSAGNHVAARNHQNPKQAQQNKHHQSRAGQIVIDADTSIPLGKPENNTQHAKQQQNGMLRPQAILQTSQKNQMLPTSNSNHISLGKSSASKDKPGGQEGINGNNFSHNNDERSTGEISNQGQAGVLPLNVAAAAAGQQKHLVAPGDPQSASAIASNVAQNQNPGNALAQTQLQLLLQMHLLQQAMPAGGQVMPPGASMASAPQQPQGNAATDQQNYLLMMMLSGQMADPTQSAAAAATIDNGTSIPVGQTTAGGGLQSAPSGKKKKGAQGKNRGANASAAAEQNSGNHLKRQKVENDDVIPVRAEVKDLNAVPLDDPAKDGDDKSMRIDIGPGAPPRDGKKRKGRAASSRSSSFSSSSSSQKSSDDSSSDDERSGSGSNSASSNSQDQSSSRSKKKTRRRHRDEESSSGAGSECGQSASKSMGERRAEKFQAKQQGKPAPLAQKNPNAQKKGQPTKKPQAPEQRKVPEHEDGKRKPPTPQVEQSPEKKVAPASDVKLTKVPAAASPAEPPQAPSRPQKNLTPYEKILKLAATEARTFNHNFDIMRQTNREHFQVQSLQTARTERPSLESFSSRKRHSQFLTNFYYQPHSQHAPLFSSGGSASLPSSSTPAHCLPFYNQLNLISAHLAQHQQKRQQLPTHSSGALRDAMADLQRRKDELIRSRHALLECQEKIYQFHLDQVDRRARNHQDFTQKHRRYWAEIRDRRDEVGVEIERAEQELAELLKQNVDGEAEAAPKEAERHQEGEEKGSDQDQEEKVNEAASKTVLPEEHGEEGRAEAEQAELEAAETVQEKLCADEGLHLEANPEEKATEAVRSAVSQERLNMDSQKDDDGQEQAHEDEEKVVEEQVQPAEAPSAEHNEHGEM